MSKNNIENYAQLIYLDNNTSENNIADNKRFSKISKKAKANTKKATCYFCGKECSSFCKSHSIPDFILSRIAENGQLISLLQGKYPTTGRYTGVNDAGTFFLICRECDSKVFQDYETEKAFDKTPSDKILSEIALKNYLLLIYRRIMENEIHRLRSKNLRFRGYSQEKIDVGQTDLSEFQSQFFYAKKALSNQIGEKYYLGYYIVVDYVVPYAAQAAITLCVDFEDNIVNNVYEVSKDYRIEQIHVSVFPLKGKSVISLFTENGSKRYRKFYKQLKKLSQLDQLAAINYIIFSYTENVFMSPEIAQQVSTNPSFEKVCRKTTDFISNKFIEKKNVLPLLIKEFSLSQRNCIPNLLSPDFALK